MPPPKKGLRAPVLPSELDPRTPASLDDVELEGCRAAVLSQLFGLVLRDE